MRISKAGCFCVQSPKTFTLQVDSRRPPAAGFPADIPPETPADPFACKALVRFWSLLFHAFADVNKEMRKINY